ncbi:MAG: hypothetical protein AMS27_10185 [Bacteroides sp. SM23_62_1]|nr:MAG: hypothetical protein AMS27_10185 [Bacteroides sp. SM23_62_1]
MIIQIFSILMPGCDEDTGRGNPLVFEFSFESGMQNWECFFSDYPVGEEEFYELEFEHTFLPESLDQNTKALKISGNNHSDDLFSAIYRKFDNLKPDHTYSVTFDIELASNAPSNAFGVGGSPDLALGAGGISYPPENSIDDINHYRPNFESLLQSGLSNPVLRVLGTIGVSEEIPTPFMLINRNNIGNPIDIPTNSNGEIWLMIATDSGFESTTTLYYKSIKIEFE